MPSLETFPFPFSFFLEESFLASETRPINRLDRKLREACVLPFSVPSIHTFLHHLPSSLAIDPLTSAKSVSPGSSLFLIPRQTKRKESRLGRPEQVCPPNPPLCVRLSKPNSEPIKEEEKKRNNKEGRLRLLHSWAVFFFFFPASKRGHIPFSPCNPLPREAPKRNETKEAEATKEKPAAGTPFPGGWWSGDNTKKKNGLEVGKEDKGARKRSREEEGQHQFSGERQCRPLQTTRRPPPSQPTVAVTMQEQRVSSSSSSSTRRKAHPLR